MSVPIPKVLSWPLGGVDEQGRYGFVSDDDSVREVIRNILLTRPGERLKRRAFGAGIANFIHQGNSVTTRTMMADVIRKAIAQWETRVIIEQVDVLPDQQQLSVVHIVIRYCMRHSRSSSQLNLSMDLERLDT